MIALLCESVDEILLSNHLNETSLVRMFSIFYKMTDLEIGLNFGGSLPGGSPVGGVGKTSDRNGVKITSKNFFEWRSNVGTE